MSAILQWTPSHEWAGVGRPARTYLQQPCTDTGCSLEDLPNVMDDRDEWRMSKGNPCLRHDIIIINNNNNIIITVTIPCEFSTSALFDGLLLESERQQVSSSLQDYSQYYGRPHRFPNIPAPLPRRWGPLWVHHIQLVSPSLSCYLAFFSPLARSKYLSHFFSISGRLGQKNQQVLAGIRWSVYISKSQRIFCVSHCRMDSDLWTYHLAV